jgi:hypothetical protein
LQPKTPRFFKATTFYTTMLVALLYMIVSYALRKIDGLLCCLECNLETF